MHDHEYEVVRTPAEIIAEATGISNYRTYLDDEGNEVHELILPSYVSKEFIPDARETTMIRAAGAAVVMLGVAALLKNGADFLNDVLEKNQQAPADGSVFAMGVAMMLTVAGAVTMGHAGNRKEIADVMNSVNDGTIFESTQSEIPHS